MSLKENDFIKGALIGLPVALCIIGILCFMTNRRYQKASSAQMAQTAQPIAPAQILPAAASQDDQVPDNAWWKNQPPLIDAIEKEDVQAVKELLANKTDANTADVFGHTALWTATEKNHTEIARLLLEAGADPNIKPKFENGSPFLNAVRRKNKELIELLWAAKPDLTATDPWGNTALIIAIENKDIELARQLIEAGADVNAHNGTLTPLMAALDKATFYPEIQEIIALLQEHKADINTPNKDGETALMKRAAGATKTFKQVLDMGAEVNLKDKNGLTALMHSASVPENVKLLLEKNADVNAQTEEGMTALIYAAAHGSVKAVQQLLQAKADANAKTKDGITPLIAAAGGWDVLDGKDHVAGAIYSGGKIHTQIGKMLLDAGAKVNAKTKDKKTALSWAMQKNRTELADLLKQAGAK